MPCSVGTRVGLQPAHREREQQYDDHQQGEEDAPAQRYRHLLRIAFTEHQPEGVKQLADDEQQHEYQNDLDQHLGILLDMRDSAARDKRRPWHHRRWFVLLFTLVVTAGLCKLAFWQWQRGMEKTAWLAQMAKMQQAGPRTLAQIDWQHPESLDGQPLQGKAEWISPYVWLLDNQIVNGEVGYDVLIPVRAEGGSSLLLVNLGWVPAPSDRSQLPNPAIPAAMTLEGVLRMAPGGFLLGQNIEPGPYPNRLQSIRVETLRQAIGVPLADAVLYQRRTPFLYHYQHNVMPPEKHRAYAVQWLGLALVVLSGGSC